MSQGKSLKRIRKNSPTQVEFGGEISILEAREGQTVPRFEIQAYNGGKLPVKGFDYPVVVELSSASFERDVTKINRNHDQARELGHTEEQEILATGIQLAGVLSVPGSDRDEIVEAAKAEFPWDASIEASFPKPQFVERGKQRNVNGQLQSGPFYFARNAVITGTAILNRGADRNTVVKIAAEENKGIDMKPELTAFIEAQGFDPETIKDNANQVAFFEAQMTDVEPQPIKSEADITTDIRAIQAAEIQRSSEITSICAQHGNPTIEVGEGENKKTVSLAAHAVNEGLPITEVKLEAKLFDLNQKSGGGAPAAHVNNEGPANELQEAICASLAQNHFGISEESAAKSYSDKAMDQATSKDIRQQSLHSIMARICDAAGMHYRGATKSMDFWNHTLKAQEKLEQLEASGTTTLNIPNLLENVLNKTQLDAFELQSPMWRNIAHVASTNDFKQMSRVRLTAQGGYRRIGKDGEIKHVSVEDSKRTNQADTFGAMMSLTRKDIINDDLGALSKVASMLGMMAGQRLEEEVWITLLGNQGNFFSAVNKNVATAALDITGMATVRDVFMNRVNKNKKPIMIGPSMLFTGVPLTDAANDLYTKTEFAVGNTTAGTKLTSTKNNHYGKYVPYATPYLSNSDIRDSEGKAIPSQSNDVWYLTTMPTAMLHAIEVVFLNGMQAPTTSTSDMEFNKLGVQYRSYHDFGVAFGDEEAAVKVN